MPAVFDLVEGTDVQATESKLALYQRENQSSIAAVAARNVI